MNDRVGIGLWVAIPPSSAPRDQSPTALLNLPIIVVPFVTDWLHIILPFLTLNLKERSHLNRDNPSEHPLLGVAQAP